MSPRLTDGKWDIECAATSSSLSGNRPGTGPCTDLTTDQFGLRLSFGCWTAAKRFSLLTPVELPLIQVNENVDICAHCVDNFHVVDHRSTYTLGTGSGDGPNTQHLTRGCVITVITRYRALQMRTGSSFKNATSMPLCFIVSNL